MAIPHEQGAQSSASASAASSSLLLSSSMMAGTSPTPSFPVSLLVSPATSLSPSATRTTSSAQSIASNESLSTPSIPSTISYVSATDSLLPSTGTAVSGSSPPSMSSSLMGATTLAATTNNPTLISSFASQHSVIPAPFTQTGTTHEQTQTASSDMVSVTSSANRNPLTSLGGGALATNTQIGTSLSSHSTFFDNRGAVIGTFVVVAIFSTAILACLGVVWRRWLRRRNHNSMFENITFPSDDFGWRYRAGSHDQPTMSPLGTSAFASAYKGETLHGISAGDMPATASTINKTRLSYDGHFNNHFGIDHASKGQMGMAIKTNSRVDSPVPSLAPSTPSIYPPSLPPMETECDVTWPMVHSTPLSMRSIDPPPRPPRRRRPPPPYPSNPTGTPAMLSSPTTPVSSVTAVTPTSFTGNADKFSSSSISDLHYPTNTRLERGNTP